MTFNIDGLNEESLPERTAKVVELLKGDEAHRPDVIMLQEVSLALPFEVSWCWNDVVPNLPCLMHHLP